MTREKKKAVREIILACDYFANLPPEATSTLQRMAKIITLKEGDILFEQGDVPDSFYILSSGCLFAFLTSIHQNKIVVGQIHPFEPVGELSTLALKPRSMTVEAKVNSTLLRLPIPHFRELCIQYPAIIADLSQFIVRRFMQTLKIMINEKSTINVSLFYNNNPQNTYISHRLFALKSPDLLVISCDSLNIQEIEPKINEASLKQLNLLFVMKKWDSVFFDELKKWLTHVYIVVYKEESEFTNESKTILHELGQIFRTRHELIIIHPEKNKRIDNTRKWLDKADFNLHHHIKINDENDFARLTRFIRGKAVTLVLGGGGAKGLSHLGVIKALIEKNIPIDAVGGTSIGSLVAACFGLNLNYDQALELIQKLKSAAIKSLSFTNLVWPIISLYSSDPATRLLIYLMNNVLIEDLPIPYFAVASNIKNKSAVIMKRGLVWEAVRSSASVPGLFPPLVFNGHLYADGGLLNNLPVDFMREVVGDKNYIIASSLSRCESNKVAYAFPPVLTLKRTLLLKLGIGKSKYVIPPLFETFIEALLLGSSEREDYNARTADILIRPNFKDFKTFLFKRLEDENKLIQIGYDETIKVIHHFQKNKF